MTENGIFPGVPCCMYPGPWDCVSWNFSINKKQLICVKKGQMDKVIYYTRMISRYAFFFINSWNTWNTWQIWGEGGAKCNQFTQVNPYPDKLCAGNLHITTNGIRSIHQFDELACSIRISIQEWNAFRNFNDWQCYRRSYTSGAPVYYLKVVWTTSNSSKEMRKTLKNI